MPASYTRDQRLALAKERGILVDLEDEWLLEEYTWHAWWDGYNYYAKTMVKGTPTSLHHAIVGQPIWEGYEVDHINRNGLDDRRQNLRIVTRSINRINTSREPGISGTRYVYYVSGQETFYVQIKRNKIVHYLGTFDTMDEAIIARDQWLTEQE